MFIQGAHAYLHPRSLLPVSGRPPHSKENTVLRAHIPPSKVSVIPNAVDSDLFAPVARQVPGGVIDGRMTIVVVSRYVVSRRTKLARTTMNIFNNILIVFRGDGCV